MKKDQNVCPGCHRHCPLSSVRCKYGRNYVAKQQAEPPKAACAKSGKPKWEACVTQGSAVWSLLSTSRSIKKSLRRSQSTEAQILSALDSTERSTLLALLNKLDKAAAAPSAVEA